MYEQAGGLEQECEQVEEMAGMPAAAFLWGTSGVLVR